MPDFTINHILQMTDKRTFDRGLQYFKQGRVVLLEDDGNNPVLASVRGSFPYEVAVFWDQGHLAAECTCPVGFNCKHGVATALQWLQELQRQRNPRRQPSAPAAQPLDRWLQTFPQAATNAAQAPRPGAHQVLYQLVVSPQQTALTLLKGYLKQNGEWSQMKPFSPDFSMLRYSRPSHINDSDEAILRQLQSRREINGQFSLEGEPGALTLTQALATGRLLAGDPLTLVRAGPARPLQWRWQQRDDTYQLQGELEGAGAWQPLLVSPPRYLEAATGQIGEIISPMTGPQLAHLLSMPPINSADMARVAMSLRQHLDATQLPLPQEPELIEASICTPHLTLVSATVGSGARLPALLIAFDYAGLRIDPDYGRPYSIAPTLLEQDGKYYRLSRDSSAETACLDHVHGLGFALFAELGPWRDVWMPDVHNTTDLLHFWQQFRAEHIPELESRGWQISADASFRLNVSAAAFTVHLKDNRNHWFDFDLELRLGDLTFNTMDVVGAWLDADCPATLALPMDGDWISIDTQPLQVLRSLIMELFNQKKLNKPVALPAFQAAQLHDLPGLDDRHAPLTRKLMRDLQHFTGLEPVPVSPQLRAELRPYQQQGLNWLVFLQRYGFGGVLADDMGLGKTVQTLALIQHLKDHKQLKKPALIVAPTSLMGNWVREATQFAPGLRVNLIHGPRRDPAFALIGKSDLVITSYPLLVRDADRYRKHTFSVLVLDEAQAIKNPNTKVAQQVRELKTATRLCLSGTPLENHLGELWALLDFALPGLLGGHKTFNQLYRKPIEEDGDSQRQQELAQRVAPFMLRRTKADVMAELPPKTEITQYVELEGKQRALYESIRISMEKRIRDLVNTKGLARSHIEFLDALLKLRQACIDPRLVKLDKAAGISEHAKLDWLADNIPQMLEEGRNILVFSQFTEVLGLIEDLLKQQKIAYSKLTGQTRKRQEAIDSFQSGATRVFLISLKAGGSGLNLTAADVVIHIDPWWNPAVENQATDRAHRMGQDKPVFVYKLVAADTVEERIQQLQQQKQALADALFSATGAAGMPVDGEQLLALLGA